MTGLKPRPPRGRCLVARCAWAFGERARVRTNRGFAVSSRAQRRQGSEERLALDRLHRRVEARAALVGIVELEKILGIRSAEMDRFDFVRLPLLDMPLRGSAATGCERAARCCCEIGSRSSRQMGSMVSIWPAAAGSKGTAQLGRVLQGRLEGWIGWMMSSAMASDRTSCSSTEVSIAAPGCTRDRMGWRGPKWRPRKSGKVANGPPMKLSIIVACARAGRGETGGVGVEGIPASIAWEEAPRTRGGDGGGDGRHRSERPPSETLGGHVPVNVGPRVGHRLGVEEEIPFV